MRLSSSYDLSAGHIRKFNVASVPCIGQPSYTHTFFYTQANRNQTTKQFILLMPFTVGKDTGSSSSHFQWHSHFSINVQKRIKRSIKKYGKRESLRWNLYTREETYYPPTSTPAPSHA